MQRKMECISIWKRDLRESSICRMISGTIFRIWICILCLWFTRRSCETSPSSNRRWWRYFFPKSDECLMVSPSFSSFAIDLVFFYEFCMPFLPFIFSRHEKHRWKIMLVQMFLESDKEICSLWIACFMFFTSDLHSFCSRGKKCSEM